MPMYILDTFKYLLLQSPLWTLAFALFLIFCISRWLQDARKKYPPGPMGLPVLGYLPFLGNNDHIALDKLRKTYGGIFSMRWGVRDVVVLSDFKLIREAFNKDEVSHRPPDMMRFTDKKDIEHLQTMNLKDWKESRKFMVSTLRTLGIGKNKVEESIMEDFQNLVENLSKSVGQSKVNIRDYMCHTVNRVIIAMICGSSHGDNAEFSKIVDIFGRDVLQYLNIYSLGFYLPFLKPFIPIIKPEIKNLKTSIDNMEQLMSKEISKHEKDIDKDSKDDFMDYFIAEMKKVTGSATLTHGVLNGNSQILLVAGSDTTFAAIEWILLLLAQHPEVQERAYQEIVQAVGKERPPSWSERDDFPYLDAIIAEASRMRTVAPLNVPHWVGQDTTIGQYNIPRGTMIVANLYSVHMNPDLWDEPDLFKPDRFMTPDGKRAKDPDFFLPFSTGKNKCPGEKLGRMELFLCMGVILQSFIILPPPGGVNLDSKLDFVLHAIDPVVKLEAR